MDDYLEQILEKRYISLSNENSLRSRARGWILFLPSGTLFALFALLIFLSGCSDDESIRKLASLDARLERVEDKLTQIEERMERIVQLESKVKAMDKSISELKTPTIPKTEKARYHEVRQGDNLSVIAQEYGMTVQELCRLNRIAPQTIIRPGQMLLVTPGG